MYRAVSICFNLVIFIAKEEKLNNLSLWFVGETLRAKAGKMPALLY
jgi:hypothetical protein